ncbi:PKS-NRPS hybrid synthetase, partial [Golovinomyces cichoracearum]
KAVNIFVGVKPGQTITYLRQITTNPTQPYDIYNLNASFRRKQRHGLSANDALLRHFKDKRVHFKINATPTNRIRHLFIAYPQSIQLAQTNQDVILVDNTYKTNKFDMPLLHIISITSSGMTLSIGFCFLPSETEEDFIWAFKCFQGLGINPAIIVIDGDQAQKNASEEVFPDTPTLLCVWHVNQCVLAKCKSKVGDEHWLE